MCYNHQSINQEPVNMLIIISILTACHNLESVRYMCDILISQVIWTQSTQSLLSYTCHLSASSSYNAINLHAFHIRYCQYAITCDIPCLINQLGIVKHAINLEPVINDHVLFSLVKHIGIYTSQHGIICQVPVINQHAMY